MRRKKIVFREVKNLHQIVSLQDGIREVTGIKTLSMFYEPLHLSKPKNIELILNNVDADVIGKDALEKIVKSVNKLHKSNINYVLR